MRYQRKTANRRQHQFAVRLLKNKMDQQKEYDLRGAQFMAMEVEIRQQAEEINRLQAELKQLQEQVSKDEEALLAKEEPEKRKHSREEDGSASDSLGEQPALKRMKTTPEKLIKLSVQDRGQTNFIQQREVVARARTDRDLII